MARSHGHLFQNRFGSVAMDEAHLLAAVRYVSLNPVRARLVPHAEDWPWSSVRAHLAGESDELVNVTPVLSRVADFAGCLWTQTTQALLPFEPRKERAGRSAMPTSSPALSAYSDAPVPGARPDPNPERATTTLRNCGNWINCPPILSLNLSKG